MYIKKILREIKTNNFLKVSKMKTTLIMVLHKMIAHFKCGKCLKNNSSCLSKKKLVFSQ